MSICPEKHPVRMKELFDPDFSSRACGAITDAPAGVMAGKGVKCTARQEKVLFVRSGDPGQGFVIL